MRLQRVATIPGLLGAVLAAGCGGARPTASAPTCADTARLDADAAARRDQGDLFGALALRERAASGCATAATRAALAEARADLEGPAPEAGDPAPHVAAATTAWLRGDLAAASTELERASRFGRDARTLGLLALAYQRTGRLVAARRTGARAFARASAAGGTAGLAWNGSLTAYMGNLRVTLSPDRQLAATYVDIPAGRRVTVWDVLLQRDLYEVPGGLVPALGRGRDGRQRLAVTTGEGDGIEVRDAATGRLERALPDAAADWLAFAPDGVLVTGRGNQVTEWDVVAGTRQRSWSLPTGSWVIAMSGDGETLLVAGKRAGVCARKDARPALHALGLTPLAISRDGAVVVGRDGNRLRVARSDGAVGPALAAKEVLGFADDGTLLTRTGDLVVRWDPRTGAQVATVTLPARAAAERFIPRNAPWPRPDLLAGGELLATLDGEQAMVLYEVAGGRAVVRLGHRDAIGAIAWSTDGQRLAFAGENGSWIRLWDLRSGSVLEELDVPEGDAVVALALDSDERVAASMGKRGVVVWDRLDALPRRLDPPAHPMKELAFAGNRLLGRSGDVGNVAWDVATGKLLQEAHTDPFAVLTTRHSPDGTLRATMQMKQGRVFLWDAATRRALRVLTSEAMLGEHLVLGRSIAIADDASGVVHVWDVATGGVIGILGEPGRSVSAMMLHPDERLVAIGRDDGRVEVWDARSTRLMVVLAAPRGGRWIAVSPDGRVDGDRPEPDDPWSWTAGGVALPGIAGWDRQRRPVLLGEVARLPAAPARRPSPPAAIPVASCAPAPDEEDNEGASIDDAAIDGDVLHYCDVYTSAGYQYYPVDPVCWRVHLTSGTVEPAPVPLRVLAGSQDLTPVDSDDDAPTATIHPAGRGVEVCAPGAPCRRLSIELKGVKIEESGLAVSDDGAFVAVLGPRDRVETWDVATGKRLARFKAKLDEGTSEFPMVPGLRFWSHALLAVSHCEGPCASAVMYDVRTGKRLADIDEAYDFSPMRLWDDVWVYTTEFRRGPMVIQDATTGRVIARLELGDRGYPMLWKDALVIVGGGKLVGQVLVVNREGRITRRIAAPLCRPE